MTHHDNDKGPSGTTYDQRPLSESGDKGPLIGINTALQQVLKTSLGAENSDSIDIRFDLPDVNAAQAVSTISVFLYDVHEDTKLRQGNGRRYDPSTGQLAPAVTHLNCNYLITYWEAQASAKDGSGPDSQPDNQSAQIMTRVLQALLNHRQLPSLPDAWTRVIPPQENLNSLGNFWQALGNRPRLSLMYSITVPVALQQQNRLPVVKQAESHLDQFKAD